MIFMSLLTCCVVGRTKAEGGACSCGTCCGCPKATKCTCGGGVVLVGGNTTGKGKERQKMGKNKFRECLAFV